MCEPAGDAACESAGESSCKPAGESACEPAEIHIAPGIYHEHLDITEPYVALIGAGPDETIITGDLGGYEILEDGLKRGTFRTQTVFVHTHDFTARDLTIENTAGPGHIAGQAIALYADGDRLYFENVHLKGFQDTLFTGPLPPKEVEPGGFRGPLEHAPRINGRQYYRKCTIEGSIDFIYGSATAYFEECILVSRDEYGDSALRNDVLRNMKLANAESTQIKDAPPVRSYVTAASTPEGQKYGYVFADCTFTGDCPAESCYLGRPWREYAQVVLIRCSIGPHIRPEGWHDWGKEAAHETAAFAEFECSYAGRAEDAAGGLRRHLSAEDVLDYEKDKVLGFGVSRSSRVPRP
ncbi:MAG: pectin methylesterase [Lachnospiraceae bacterium]|nr:pectin methylesterase [Lachnospiraceae bacterium]